MWSAPAFLKNRIRSDLPDAHQQALGNAFGVSAAGVHAINLMQIHVLQQPLAEKVTCTVQRCAGEDVSRRAELVHLSVSPWEENCYVFFRLTFKKGTSWIPDALLQLSWLSFQFPGVQTRDTEQALMIRLWCAEPLQIALGCSPDYG